MLIENYISNNFMNKVNNLKMNPNSSLLGIEKSISYWIDNKKANKSGNKYNLGMHYKEKGMNHRNL